MNGWKNYETWNLALHLGSDEATVHKVRLAWRLRARFGSPYKALLKVLGRDFVTGDGVRITDSRISRREIAECIKELAA